MKLYYSKAACSLVVRIIINELNIPADFESVNLKTKVTETGKNYLEINPKGAVPCIELDNGKHLSENAVILQYLADKHHATQLLPSVEHQDRYFVLEWLNYITTELHKSFGVLFNPTLSEEIKKEFFMPMLLKKFEYVDDKLAKNEFLFGNHFTLPDAYLYVMIRWLNAFKIDLAKFPNLKRFFEDISKRPAIAKSISDEGLM